jgi:hypothetical protein
LIKNFKLKIKNFLRNLQSQPDKVKKIILWSTVSVVGFILILLWWFFIFQRALKNFNSENLKKGFNLPELEEKLGNLPPLETPKINEEELKKLEEEIKKIEEEKTATSEK